jgi:uncharacterized protein YecT (DUF1311 family)
MNVRHWVALAAAIAGLCFLGAHPASAIDCGAAKTRAEQAICADPQLRRADDELASAYVHLKGTVPPDQREPLRASRLLWIKQRESCSADLENDAGSCVRGFLEERLVLLSGKPESGDAPAQLRFVPWFRESEAKPGAWGLDVVLDKIAEPRSPGEELYNHEAESLIAPAPLDGAAPGPDLPPVPADKTYGYDARLHPTYVSDILISAFADGYTFTGGAHGIAWSRSLNIDLRNGRDLTFADLFPLEAVGPLAKQCTDQLIAERRGKLNDPTVNLDEGADIAIVKSIRELSRWSFRADRATVTFDPEEIGAHVEGGYACSFDLTKLRSLAVSGANLPK